MPLPIPSARMYRLDQLTLKDLRELDRARTIVLMPIGMVEEHGNHLPLGTDNYAVEAMVLAAAAWLLENDKGLQILQMPLLPFGTDPVDLRRKELFAEAGSIWLSRETFKRVIVELAGHLVRYGFRYIFPVGFHGGAEQSVALEELCAEMRAKHPGLVMYEPTGYVMAGAGRDETPGLATLLGRPLTLQEELALKGSIHASMFETSMMLHLQPKLVDPTYKNLGTIEWDQLYHMPDWPGYVGTGPRHAKAEIGAAVVRWRGVRAGIVIRQAMDGKDLSRLPRHPTWLAELGEGGEEEVTVTEAPREGELVSSKETEIDSKPAMYISAEDLSEIKEQAAESASLEETEETQKIRPKKGKGKAAPEAKTPPSALLETKPDLKTKSSDKKES